MRELLFLTMIIVSSLDVSISEPHCACSKFPYEEKLLEKMVRMEYAVERMKNEIEDAEQKVRKTLEEFHKIKSQHEKAVEESEKHSTGKKPPAFAATLSVSLRSLGYQQHIVFDNILTNIGLAYSGKTGVFTAPQNGVYYFIATVMSESNKQVQTEIVKNGQSIVKTFSFDKSHEQSTSGVVLQLETSDEVWVRHLTAEVDNMHGYNWSSFSGFQISD